MSAYARMRVSTTERTVKRSEVWMADLGYDKKGSEQWGKRPVVIISNEKNNFYSSTVNVVPLSSAVKRPLPQHVPIKSVLGLERDSFALLEQISTLSKVRLDRKITTLDENTMKEIQRAAKMQFAFE